MGFAPTEATLFIGLLLVPLPALALSAAGVSQEYGSDAVDGEPTIGYLQGVLAVSKCNYQSQGRPLLSG